jgi:hypothetical protein
VCVAIKTKKRGCAKPIRVHSQPDARTMVQFRVSLSATGRPTRRAIATNHWLGSGGGALGSGFLGSVASNVHTDRIRAGQLNRAATSLQYRLLQDAWKLWMQCCLYKAVLWHRAPLAAAWSLRSRASDDGIPRCRHRKANLSATANPGESSTKR